MARKRDRIRWNIGMIIFLIIFVYVIINVALFLFRDKLTVYEVEADRVTETYGLTGIAVRDEKLLKADQKGTITYYVEEGKRVKKKGTLFLIDQNGKAQKAFAKEVEALRKEGEVEDDSQVEQSVEHFQTNYDDSRYSEVYNLKGDLKNTTLNLDESTIKKLTASIESQLGNDTFQTTSASASGIVTYYSDNFNGKKVDDIKTSDFDQDDYKKINYRSSSKVKKGNVVARINRNEEWSIVVPLEKNQYNQLKEKKSVSVKFLQDQISATADISVEKKGNDYLGILTFDDYAVRYINDRYLDIEITLDNYSGLKIPNTAIVKKEFYEVPVEYITKGNDNSGEGFSVRTTNKDGEAKVEQKDYTIYKRTNKYCYLDPDEVGEDVVLQSMNSDDTFLVNREKSLEGVYCTNRGYADFRVIDVVLRQEDFSIIDDDTEGGLSLYDFIVEDSKTADENQIVY